MANTTKYSEITPVRKSLHWLPIMPRSIFKTVLVVFAYDATLILNDLSDDVHSAKSLPLFRKKLKTYLFFKSLPTLVFSGLVSILVGQRKSVHTVGQGSVL